jgi:uncharacterized protein (DUF1697 family)
MGSEDIEYVALLRGVNVGGHAVRMEVLRGLFRELGLTDVRSYIQSGNVFFACPPGRRAGLAAQIEGHLARNLGYEVPVILRTVPELAQVVARDPFRDVVVTPDTRLCVVFAAETLARLNLPVRSAKGDVEIIDMTAQEAFLIWRLVNGRPPDSENFLARTLHTQLTTRFFHTTAKILEAAQAH